MCVIHAMNSVNHYATPPTKWFIACLCAVCVCMFMSLVAWIKRLIPAQGRNVTAGLVSSNTVWSHTACEFSWHGLLTAILCLHSYLLTRIQSNEYATVQVEFVLQTTFAYITCQYSLIRVCLWVSKAPAVTAGALPGTNTHSSQHAHNLNISWE